MTEILGDDDPAKVFDHALTWKISSRERAHTEHQVELGHYKGNGECSCEHFDFHCRPHLARGLTPQQAVAFGLVKLKKNQKIKDALRCYHIMEARDQFAELAVRALVKAETLSRKIKCE